MADETEEGRQRDGMAWLAQSPPLCMQSLQAGLEPSFLPRHAGASTGSLQAPQVAVVVC